MLNERAITIIAHREFRDGFHVKLSWQADQWECQLSNNARLTPNYQPRGYGETEIAAYEQACQDRAAAIKTGKYKLVSPSKTAQDASTLKAGLPR